jgi:hypothetical protein
VRLTLVPDLHIEAERTPAVHVRRRNRGGVGGHLCAHQRLCGTSNSLVSRNLSRRGSTGADKKRQRESTDQSAIHTGGERKQHSNNSGQKELLELRRPDGLPTSQSDQVFAIRPPTSADAVGTIGNSSAVLSTARGFGCSGRARLYLRAAALC